MIRYVHMKNRILLSFEEKPLSVMYRHIAFPLGVIQGNAKGDIMPWLCHRFVNCVFYPISQNHFSISLSDHWGIEEGIHYRQQIQLFYSTYNEIGIDVIQLLTQMLAQGYYVCGDWNEEYIPGKQAYKIEYFLHDYLLIGFDSEKEVFLAADSFTDRFSVTEIPYTSMRDSLKTLADGKPVLLFYRFNSEADFSFDTLKTYTFLKDYLSSSNSLPQYTKGAVYGLEALDALREHYASLHQKNSFDHRYSKGLMEHKRIMQMRINYLYQNLHISNSHCVACAKEAYELSCVLHNMGIRFKMLGDDHILKEINVIMQRMKSIELSYLPSVKNELERRL